MRAHRSAASPLQLYAEFHRRHPAIVMPADYVTECGRLGRWQDRLRVARMLGTLPPQRITQLDSIGFVWTDDSAPLPAVPPAEEDRNRAGRIEHVRRFPPVRSMHATAAHQVSTHAVSNRASSYVGPDTSQSPERHTSSRRGPSASRIRR